MPAPRQPETIGRFKVLRPIGQGGMGAVFLVEDPLVGRQVALKRIRADQLQLEAMQRLLREATLLARVVHPNVVRVHEAGWIDEGPYLLMDYVEGQSLGSLRQPLGPREVARIVRDLAGAVERLHAEGILHRDIKPSNVLLRADGSPVLLDFGIARDARAETLTRTGQSLGTPAYMAPEQTSVERSKELTAAVDVYGLGVLAFELLTGRPPYLGTPMNVLCALLEEDVPPPSRHAQGVPAALDAIVLRATARDPSARYPSARELAADLERFLAGQEVEARPRPRLALAALGALALAALLGLGWLASPPTPSEPGEAAAAPRRSPSARTTPSPELELPRWYRRLSEPPWLPVGLVPTEVSGEYRWERTGTILVWVPPGSFRMGSGGGAFHAATVEPSGRAISEREVEVRLTRGVFMGKYEVTWADWARFAEVSGAATPANVFSVLPVRKDFVRSTRRVEPWSAPSNHPIVRVTRADALAYCEWAGLRLPTEAEWARAARGDSQDPYVYGPEPESGACNNLLRDGHPFTSPVGAYPRDRSPYGCYDMGGNAAELVSDFYAPYPEGPLVDPKGPPQGEDVVVRGPSWESDLPLNRSLASRHRQSPERRANFTGFRVALDPPR